MDLCGARDTVVGAKAGGVHVVYYFEISHRRAFYLSSRAITIYSMPYSSTIYAAFISAYTYYLPISISYYSIFTHYLAATLANKDPILSLANLPISGAVESISIFMVLLDAHPVSTFVITHAELSDYSQASLFTVLTYSIYVAHLNIRRLAKGETAIDRETEKCFLGNFPRFFRVFTRKLCFDLR